MSDPQPGTSLLFCKAYDQLRVQMEPEPSAGPVGAHRATMPEAMVGAAVRHCHEKRLVGSRIEHVIHVDVVERLMAKFALVDRGGQLVFDGMSRSARHRLHC